jgi:hypothetical protein
MTKLCFFNFYHNGDLFHSKPFVREVISALGKENVQYAHEKDPKVLQDLEIGYAKVRGLTDKVKSFHWAEQDVLLVNTWIGSYFDLYEGECTLSFNMKMWKHIYALINQYFQTNLKLGPIEDYMPYVDYSKFKVDQIDDWLNTNSNTKILFSNGVVLSGQCEYTGDMADIIVESAEKHPNITFLTTNQIRTSLANVIHTAEIIRSDNCDLNEIAYLSRACSLIIGRNSGPFCFASTGENLNDPSKTFYAYGIRHSDCFTMGILVKSNYIFEKYEDYDAIKETIKKLISAYV